MLRRYEVNLLILKIRRSDSDSFVYSLTLNNPNHFVKTNASQRLFRVSQFDSNRTLFLCSFMCWNRLINIVMYLSGLSFYEI